jgi:hypothetical protein
MSSFIPEAAFCNHLVGGNNEIVRSDWQESRALVGVPLRVAPRSHTSLKQATLPSKNRSSINIPTYKILLPIPTCLISSRHFSRRYFPSAHISCSPSFLFSSPAVQAIARPALAPFIRDFIPSSPQFNSIPAHPPQCPTAL